MPTPGTQSGFLIEGNDNSEIVFTTANAINGVGIPTHWWVPDSNRLNGSSQWRSGAIKMFGNDGYNRDAVVYPSLIQSSFGYLEVVGRNYDRLAHAWRDGVGNWHKTETFALGAVGSPAFIQGKFGSKGNFEVVVPHQDGGLMHWWRDNNPVITASWRQTGRFGMGHSYRSVTMIHSNYFNNLELIAMTNSGELHHYWGGANNWSGPVSIPLGSFTSYREFRVERVSASPSLIQSTYGRNGNFELLVGYSNTLLHYWRNNDDPSLPWSAPTATVLSGDINNISLIESTHTRGLFYAAIRFLDHMELWRRNDSGWSFVHNIVRGLREPYEGNSFPVVPRGTMGTTTPPPIDNTRREFIFTLTGDWMTGDYIQPIPNGVYMRVVPPGGTADRAQRYNMSLIGGAWTVRVPAGREGEGTWSFECHIEGRDATGAVSRVSPVYTYFWQVRSPHANILFTTDDISGRVLNWYLQPIINS